MRTRLPLVIAVLGMLVVSGCTTTSPGTPLPGSSTGSSADSDLPTDGAPKVENPLDVSRFEQKPCDVLTPEDAEELNIPATGEQEGDSLGETCYWRNTQTRGSLAASFFSGDKRGLSSVYQEAKGSDFPYFEPIGDVEGHPAVAYNTEEEAPRTDCTVAVGLSDQLVFTARVALSDANLGRRKPCEVAADAAGMMMKTMLGAA